MVMSDNTLLLCKICPNSNSTDLIVYIVFQGSICAGVFVFDTIYCYFTLVGRYKNTQNPTSAKMTAHIGFCRQK